MIIPKTWLPPKWLRAWLALFLVLGIGFRFIHLDRKVYWHDEAFTSIRIAGLSNQEISETLFNGEVITAFKLRDALRIHTNKTAFDTITVTQKQPHQTPLYYVLAHFWVRLFGDSIGTIRSLSAVFSVLCLPAFYWLVMELFAVTSIASIATMLMTVSPFHLVYAQEARAYSLWTLAILLSSVMVLRAVKNPKWKNWVLYAITLTIAFYTHLFSIFLAVAHGIYVFCRENCQLSIIFKRLLTAFGVSTLLFSPWIFSIALRLKTVKNTTSWMQQSLGILKQIQSWYGGVLTIFYDSNSFFQKAGNLLDINGRIFLILIIFSVAFFWKKSNQDAKFFVSAIFIVFLLMNIIPAIVADYMLSKIVRYQIPFLICLGIIVAYAISLKIDKRSTTGQVILSFILISGLASCISYSQASSWWNKANAYQKWQAANYINQHSNLLIVSFDKNKGDLFAMSYYLKPEQQLKIFKVKNNKNFNLQETLKDVLVFNPPKKIRESLEENYQLDRVQPESLKLWQLRAKSD
ncbi:MAG: glycosyltransferase family 39 protein [Cyanobacteria bacterium SID2]|nr:glycosyltransferase family 39 protein [Cyanobacteria bacterium SID2]